MAIVDEPRILVTDTFRICRCASGPERNPGIGNAKRSAHNRRRAIRGAIKIERGPILRTETGIRKMPHMRFVIPFPVGIAVRMELHLSTAFLRCPHAIQRHTGAVVEKPLTRPSPMQPHRLRTIGFRKLLKLCRAWVETRAAAGLAEGKRAVASANRHQAKRSGKALVFVLHRYPMVPRRGRGGERAAPLAGPRALDAKMQRRHRRRGDDEHATSPLRFACDAYPPCTLLDPLR